VWIKDLVGAGKDPGGGASGRNLNDVLSLNDSDFGGRASRGSRLGKERDGTDCLDEKNYSTQELPPEFSMQFQRTF
jgi:hypothetical protein